MASRVLVQAAVAALVLTALTGPAHAAEPPACHGLLATIIGEPHGSITGTPGDDVIVTNGAEGVQASDGDDTVCVTDTPRSFIAHVDAGAGDDTVDTTGTREYTKAVLGTGADSLLGGNGGQQVLTGPSDGVDAETDRVHTLGAYDVVVTGQAGLPDADDIDLGGGDGAIEVRSNRPTGVLHAAEGSVASLRVAPLDAGRWVVDEASERATLDGEVVISWENLAMHYVDAVSGAHVRYRGTGGSDYLYLFGGSIDGVDLRAGSDSVVLARDTRMRAPWTAVGARTP